MTRIGVGRRVTGRHGHPMHIDEAQRDMRVAYVGGAPGVAASGLVWLVAAGVLRAKGPEAALLTLFFGGMAIHPAAVVLSRALGAPGRHRPDNPLRLLALESTGFLLLGVALSFALSRLQVPLFFSVMLVVIGGRYVMFNTLYGVRLYWACGAVLSAVGLCGLVGRIAPGALVLAGGLIELAFAVAFYVLHRRRSTRAAAG